MPKKIDNVSPLSSVAEDGDGEEEQDWDETGSHISQASGTSSASAKVRFFLNGSIQNNKSRLKATDELRERSEFKTPRDVPVKPHQKPQKSAAVLKQATGAGDETDERFATARTAPTNLAKFSAAPSQQGAPEDVHFTKEEIERAFSKVRHNRTDDVREMIFEKFPIEARDAHGNTMLIVAGQNNSKRMVKLLLKYRANIDAVNLKGNTALHYCCFYGHIDLAQTLRKYGARSDIRNHEGKICFMMND